MATPNMTRTHYNFIADHIGPLVGWPSAIPALADELAATNPRFDRDKFIQRATKAWEEKHEVPKVYDEIPY